MSDSGNFIVVYKASATPEQIEEHAKHINANGGQVNNRYDSVLKGFSATLTPQLVNNFQGDDIIDYIEPDGVVTTQ